MKFHEGLKRKVALVEDVIFNLFSLDEFTVHIIDDEEVTINFKLHQGNKLFF